MEKITKKQMYQAIMTYMRGEEPEVDVQAMYDFCQGQIADLDKKAAKAKERAAAKKAEADTLKDLVEAALTDEYQIIADITEAVSEQEPEATVAKVTARLKKLVDEGVAEKEQTTVGEGKAKRKVMSYRLTEGTNEE